MMLALIYLNQSRKNVEPFALRRARARIHSRLNSVVFEMSPEPQDPEGSPPEIDSKRRRTMARIRLVQSVAKSVSMSAGN
jgi:hypothetical protein